MPTVRFLSWWQSVQFAAPGTNWHSWLQSIMLTWWHGDLSVNVAIIPRQIVCATCLTLQHSFFGLIPGFRPRLISTAVHLCPGYPTLLLDCFWLWLSLIGISVSLRDLNSCPGVNRLWSPLPDYLLREPPWFCLDWVHRIPVLRFCSVLSSIQYLSSNKDCCVRTLTGSYPCWTFQVQRNPQNLCGMQNRQITFPCIDVSGKLPQDYLFR